MSKLVRDRIPEIIRANGETPIVRTAGPAEHRHLLIAKLREEADEVAAAAALGGIADELADVLEVVAAIAAAHGIDPAEVERRRAVKAAIRGGFDARVVWLGNEPARAESGVAA